MSATPYARRRLIRVVSRMRTFTAIIVILFGSFASHRAGEAYPLREAKDGEARPGWWWDLFNGPVIAVRGTLAQTQKDRPDIDIHGTYEAWSKLVDPSLANKPAEKSFYLLLTRLKVAEVLYVDPTLMNSNANINMLADRKKDEFDCILPADIVATGDLDDLLQPKPDKNGRYSFAYKLSLPGGENVPAGKEVILIFHYVSMYPMQGLHLTSTTGVNNLEQVRAIADYRRKRQPKR